MARLPIYSSERNISAQRPAPFRNEVTQEFENQQKIIGTLQNITAQWSHANDVMQETDAKGKYGVGLEQIEQEAVNDPDFKNSDRYIAKLNDLKTQSLKDIDNQFLSQQLSKDFEYKNNLAFLKIKGIQAQKQIDYTKSVAVPQEIAVYQNGMISSMTKAQFIENKDALYNTIDKNVNAGIYDYAEGEKLKKESIKSTAINAIYTDIEKGRQQIKDDYYDLTPEEKGKLLDEANSLEARRLKEATELQKEISYQTEANIALDIANNKYPSIQSLAQAVQAGTISSDFSNVALKTITSPEMVAAETDNEQFATLTQEIFKSKDKAQVQKALVNILRGGGDGKLSQDDLSILIHSAMMQGEAQQQENEKTVISLGEWADNSKIDRAETFRIFQKQIAEGKNVTVSADEVKKQMLLKTYPWVSTLPENGKVIMDENGNKLMVYPDGRTEEVK